MAKIIIDFPDSYLDWFDNSVDVFTSICQYCKEVKKPIFAGDVITYTMVAGPDVSQSVENSKS